MGTWHVVSAGCRLAETESELVLSLGRMCSNSDSHTLLQARLALLLVRYVLRNPALYCI